ncbi:hypothetical protein PAECIP111891_06966 [Paenibacillus allorhizoplanae]|uniref:Copper amine oxidase-like N-terminal domain-containing protein n=1 Tax=Paenibacillus allorhizoplanae TaxID=2905648 RepID=A0ABM9CZ51_9BACL|nr:copper amine oxidase N-terminal domain-containing protein [Paenibacillus allorhizoplanae]CAH1232195.1 hypothetical protein PAECIP111891_06966 [Paenibacillus allorhizoplanae]
MKRHKKFIAVLIAITGILTAIPLSSVHADPSTKKTPSDSAILSLKEQGDRFLFGKTKTVKELGYQPGFYMRSIHSFWDGSKAIFVNNQDPTTLLLSNNANGELVEFLIMVLQDSSSGSANVPVPAEAERRGRGLSAVAKDEKERYWTIKKGMIDDPITTPRGEKIQRERSLQLLRFGWHETNGPLMIDLAEALGQEENPNQYVFDVQFGGGVLYVTLNSLSGGKVQVAAVDPDSNKILYTLPVNNNVNVIPMKDGKLALQDQGKLTVYAAKGKEEKSIRLSELSPLLTGLEPVIFTPISGGDGYVLEQGDRWFTLNAGFSKVLAQSPRHGTFPIECPNCPGFERWLPVNATQFLYVKDQSGITLKQYDSVRINFFGEQLLTDVPAYLDFEEGRVWVPLRTMTEAMGYKVGYIEEQRQITLELPDRMLTINQDNPQIEMRTIQEYGRTYVSIRQLSELLGKPVDWEQESYTVFVAKGEILRPKVPAQLLEDWDALWEVLENLDDLVAISYTQAQIKEIWAKKTQEDHREVLQSFVKMTLQKEVESILTLSDQDGNQWIGVITKDGFVYKIHMVNRKDYDGSFWLVVAYGELVLTQ